MNLSYDDGSWSPVAGETPSKPRGDLAAPRGGFEAPRGDLSASAVDARAAARSTERDVRDGKDHRRGCPCTHEGALALW